MKVIARCVGLFSFFSTSVNESVEENIGCDCPLCRAFFISPEANAMVAHYFTNPNVIARCVGLFSFLKHLVWSYTIQTTYT